MSKLTKLSTLLLITLLTLTLTVSLASAETTGLWSYGEVTYDMAINNIGIMDGGHIIVGSTEGYGAVGEDLWMFKVDNTGAAAWNKHYGGAANESGFNVIGIPDASYAVVGCTTSYGAGMEDIWLIKTDADGNIAWNKTYGGVYDDKAG
jgi:predicted secreted protein